VVVVLEVEGGGLVMEVVLEIVVLDESKMVEYVVDGPPVAVEDSVEDEEVEKDSVVGSVLMFCPLRSVNARTTVRDATATTTTIAAASIFRDGPPVAVKRAQPRCYFGPDWINSYVLTDLAP
jgi:hypothetical protein